MKYVLVVAFLVGFLARSQQMIIDQPVRFLALGDSYTIGQSVSISARWPEQLRDSLELRGVQFDTLVNISTTGWTTGNLLNAISNQDLENDSYNLVALLIGVNNQYQGQNIANYPTEFTQLLDSAIRYAGGDTNEVFVVSIPDYAYTPFGQSGGVSNAQNISSEIDAYNAINDSISAAYGIRYFNITPISRQGLLNTNLVASDGLHPSGLQYSLWVELMLDYIDSQVLGVETTYANRVKIAPNPAAKGRNVLVAQLPDNIKEVRVYSINGRLMKRLDVSEKQFNLETKDLSSGTYILSFNTDEGRTLFTKQFVIQ